MVWPTLESRTAKDQIKLNSQGMKKLRYAIQKSTKSSWNKPNSSSSFKKQSCSRMTLYR